MKKANLSNPNHQKKLSPQQLADDPDNFWEVTAKMFNVDTKDINYMSKEALKAMKA